MANLGLTDPDTNNIGDEELEDPFSRLGYPHPALKDSIGVSADVYEALFNSIFGCDVFEEWINSKYSWQLHCIGGPGAGKTTFATLAVERIRKKYADPDECAAHVASIFIHDGVMENELALLEDLLHSVYRQLIRSALPVGHTVSRQYEKYVRARTAGSRTSNRIRLVMQALRQRVADIRQTDKAFLVIDNVDQCTSALRELLERELSTLQEEGLSILVTSRLPRHGRIADVECDFHEEQTPALDIYWRCAICEKCDICEDCYAENKLCVTCGADTVWSEPDHLDLYLDFIPRPSIRGFIAWDLEREHGDLGLGSDNPDKPSLSSFGIAFRNTMPGTAGREWVQKVTETCSGSVVQVKLALDRIHDSPTPVKYDLTPNRIPTNVQTMFGEALKNIAQQPPGHRDMAFKSMAAVGKQGDGMDGVPLSRLEVLLRERPTINSHRVPPRSVEDILQAAKGYLRLMPPGDDDEDEYTIAAFNQIFYIYAMDDYNDELIMANSQLRTSNIPRSSTWALPRLESFENVLERTRSQKSPDLATMHETNSPPIRKASSGLMRSYTFMSPGALKTASPTPPKGLGLIFEPKSYFDKTPG